MDLKLLQDLIAAHPIAYTIAVSGFSAAGGFKLLPWLESKGVDWVVNKAADWQEARGKAAGLSPAQQAVLAEHEAAVAARAAEDLQKRAQALKDAAAGPIAHS